jgi:hypothetical protein
MAKTTVHLSDELLAAAKARAAADHTTLRDLFETALRDFLDGRPRKRFKLKKAHVGGEGLSPEFADKPLSAAIDATYEVPGA